MKRTQIKDAFQNIRKRFVSFLSIFFVITLGVGIFLACRFGAAGISNSGNAFYNEYAYRDIEIRSTNGITDSDIIAVKAVNGISDAEGFFAADMVAESESGSTIGHVVSMTERVDKVIVTEGKLPENDSECAMEKDLMEFLELKVGDEIRLAAKNQDSDKYLKKDRFTVTGVIIHPEHVRIGDSVVCNILTTKDAFDAEALKSDYNGILVRTDTENTDTFTPEYSKKIDDILLSLSALGRERAESRDEELTDEAKSRIDENEAKLEEGKQELDKGQKELADKENDLIEAAGKIEAAEARLDMGREQISTSEKELEEGKARLDKAKESLDEAAAKLESGRVQLESGKAELDASQARLASAKAELDAGYEELEINRQKLADAYEQLNAARIKLDMAETAIESEESMIQAVFEGLWEEKWGEAPRIIPLRETTEKYTLSLEQTLEKVLRENGYDEEMISVIKNYYSKQSGWQDVNSKYEVIYSGETGYAFGLEEYNAGLSKWQEGKDKYEAGLAQYQSGLNQYNDGLSEYKSKEAEYNSARALYESNAALYETNLRQYEEGVRKLEEAKEKAASGETEFNGKKKEYDDGKAEIAKGKETLENKTKEYQEGVDKLEDAKKKLEAYSGGNWVFLDRSVNLSWHEISESRRTFWNIGNTFALLFILLGVMVCYATIGKIIDEQRVLVGTTRALGFTRTEILAKYLIFGGISSILGAAGGVAVSYFVLEKMIIDTIGRNYTGAVFVRSFGTLEAVLSIVIALAVAIFAAWMACRKLLLRPARILMSGEVPMGFFKEKKTPDGQREKSLYSGLIFRNIRSDLQRVVITIISIAGCCMLLVIGFTIKYSLDTVINKQFDEIIDYDSVIRFLPERSADAEEDIKELLYTDGAGFASMYNEGTIIRVGNSRVFGEIVCADPDALMRVYSLTDIKKHVQMRIPDAGVVIFNRLAEVYSLEPGDHISILDHRGVYHDAEISGIYNSYAGSTIFMSKDYAEKIMGPVAADNAFAIRHGKTGFEEMKGKLRNINGFLDIRKADEERAKYLVIAKAVNTVILVMIVMAGMMALVVLLNLIRIQINQKKRELTIMRVNGFTVSETVAYILRENIITTFLGIAVGLAGGSLVAGIIVRTIERVELQMIRQPAPMALILSALITFGFAALMNFLALRQIRKLNLRDVND